MWKRKTVLCWITKNFIVNSNYQQLLHTTVVIYVSKNPNMVGILKWIECMLRKYVVAPTVNPVNPTTVSSIYSSDKGL